MADAPFDIEIRTVNRIGDTDEVRLDGVAHSGTLNPWVVSFETRYVGGRVIVTRLGIDLDPLSFPNPAAIEWPVGGIDTRLLKSVLIGQITGAARRQMLNLGADDPVRVALFGARAADDQAFREQVERQVAVERRPQGRKPLSDEELIDIALKRLELERTGEGPVNDVLAQQLSLSRAAVRDRLHKARERGFLEKGRKGVRSAAPGPRLLPYLNQVVEIDEGGW